MSGSNQGRRSKSRPRSSTAGFEQRLLHRARNRGFAGRHHIVIGFSGGPDSCALAAALARLGDRTPERAFLVHVNHKLRPESDGEAAYALELARTIGLPCERIDLATGFQSKYPGVGIEEAARRERYLALASVARRLGTDLLATAHHQDDQVETVLLHLMRGSGLHGASGMRELSTIHVPWWDEATGTAPLYRLWRPLLVEAKTDIDAYSASCGLRPVHDPSNVDCEFRRNAVRHDVIPVLESVFPAVRESLSRFAEVASAEDELVQALADEAYDKCKADDGALRLTSWFGYPLAVQRRVMLTWLRESTVTSDVPFERVTEVCDLALTWRLSARIEVGDGRSATIIGSDLVVGTPGEVLEFAWARFPGPRIELEKTNSISVAVRTETRIGAYVFSAGPTKPNVGDPGRDWIALTPPNSGAWTARRLQPNDRFRNGHRVADWFREQLVPNMVRRRVIGVFEDEHVVWIPGLPLPARLAHPENESTTYLRWYRAGQRS